MEVWKDRAMTAMTTASDEALVLQVVKHYFPRWEKEAALRGQDNGRGSEDVDEGSSNYDASTIRDSRGNRKGAQKGERNTCVRTKAVFYGYYAKVKQCRVSLHKDAWDQATRQVAIERYKKELKGGEDGESTSASESADPVEEEIVSGKEKNFLVDMFSDIEKICV